MFALVLRARGLPGDMASTCVDATALALGNPATRRGTCTWPDTALAPHWTAPLPALGKGACSVGSIPPRSICFPRQTEERTGILDLLCDLGQAASSLWASVSALTIPED